MVKLFVLLIVLILSGVGFFSLTDPEKLPIFVLILPVILLFAIFSLATYLLLALLRLKISSRKKKSLSVLVGLLTAISLLFNSSGGMALGDFILILLILVIGILYINKF